MLEATESRPVPVSEPHEHWEDGAFRECSILPNLDLSPCANLTSIGKMAFDECKNLTNVLLSGCANLDSIGDGAFDECENLKTLDLSECKKLPEDLIKRFTRPAFVASTSLIVI